MGLNISHILQYNKEDNATEINISLIFLTLAYGVLPLLACVCVRESLQEYAGVWGYYYINNNIFNLNND